MNTTSGSFYDCTGFRLLSEAEWEYAARAGTDLVYAGSNDVATVAWYDGVSGGEYHPVGLRAANT